MKLNAQTVSLEARVRERLTALREESGYHGLTAGIVLAGGARVPLKPTDPTGAGRGGGRDAKYGLAVQVQPSEFGTIYAHGGWFPGYQTAMVYFPDQKVAIALQANQDPGLGAKKSLRACLMDLARLVLTPAVGEPARAR